MRARYAFRKKRYLALAAAADTIGHFLFAGKKRGLPQHFTPRKVLIVRLDHLGDLLPATALPQSLKEAYDGAQVHFLTNSLGEALLRHNPFVDKVWTFNPRWYARRAGTHGGMRRGALVRALKKERFDLALSLRGDAREHLLLSDAKARCIVGYGITGLGFLLNVELPYAEGVHETRHTLDILERLGIRGAELSPRLYFSEDEESEYAVTLGKHGLNGKDWVGFQLDAGASFKEWPMARFDEFLSLCEREYPNAKIAFVGTDARRGQWLEKRLAHAPSDRRISLVGKLDLRELLYFIRSARAFVGADSGPTHAAAAFGVRTLFLFGDTNEFERWKPLAENADVVRASELSGISAKQVLDWLREKACVR